MKGWITPVLPALETFEPSSWFFILYIRNVLILVFRRLRFASLPEVLVVHAKKFQLVNWVPAKLGPFISFLSLLVAYVVG
jgi:hypothetical protein